MLTRAFPRLSLLLRRTTPSFHVLRSMCTSFTTPLQGGGGGARVGGNIGGQVNERLLAGTPHVQEPTETPPDIDTARPVTKLTTKESNMAASVAAAEKSTSVATKVEIDDAALIFEYAWKNLMRKHGPLACTPVVVACPVVDMLCEIWW